MDWVIWAYIGVNLLLLIQNFSQKSRIRKLEDEIFRLKQHEWLPFARTQMHLSQVQAVKVIRAQFPELSLRQALQLYVMAKQ